MEIVKVTRRQLLIGAGGATVVAGGAGLWLGMRKVDSWLYRKPVERAGAFAPNAYLAIEPSGAVTIWLNKSEMGQGVSTALPMLVADELDADWQKVRVEQASVESSIDYGVHFTAASSGLSREWHMLRRAGATARAMLVSAAARQWGVDADECSVDAGIVYGPSGQQQASFGELADAAAQEFPPLRPTLKNLDQFKLIGQPVNRVDGRSKSTGTAVYGVDVELPNLRHAVLARSPTRGRSLISVDDGATLAVNGVEAVHALNSGVAVVATNTWAAIKGRKQLQLGWQKSAQEGQSDEDVNVALQKALDSPDRLIAEELGDVDAVATTQSVTAEYALPYLAHMCMEPMNCTVHMHDGMCEIWVPTQAPQGAQATAAMVSGLPADKIVVHITQLGGGFGRRAGQDFVHEAVELAMQVDGPVRLLWTREDDVRHAPYRDASAHRLSAKTDAHGHPVAWEHRITTAMDGVRKVDQVPFTVLMGVSDMPYAMPVKKVEWLGVPGPVPTTIWRSVGLSYNTFAIESFVDEMAAAAAVDPLAYRRDLVGNDERMQRCLETVADMSDWASSPTGKGVAVNRLGQTSVALVVEVAADEQSFRLVKAWCAVDCGIAVNPRIVEAQISGGICDGFSAAMHGELKIRNGEVQQSNFHDYPLLRMHELPPIEVRLLPSPAAPSGIGEASLPSAAPALCNALFSLTGRRIRKLPVLAAWRA